MPLMDDRTQHTRDVLAIMMAILASQDGIESAKTTAVVCWEEAGRLARMLGQPADADGPAAEGHALHATLTAGPRED